MKKMLAILLALTALPLAAQVRTPRASQKQKVTQTVGLTDITITYSRPGVKNRAIWGALVPYGQVWRTGANEATTIQFSDDVTIDGQKVPAGTYSLHTIPTATDWTIILNSVADQWGSYSYDQTKDVLRVKATPQKSPFHEWLTYEFPQVTNDQATIAIAWENVAVPFTVSTNGTEKTLASLRNAMNASKNDAWRLPYMAASFAFDNNVAGSEASQWLDQSLAAQQTLANLWLKARMQAKAGDKAGAKKTAELALAKATPSDADFAAEIRKQSAAW